MKEEESTVKKEKEKSAIKGIVCEGRWKNTLQLK